MYNILLICGKGVFMNELYLNTSVLPTVAMISHCSNITEDPEPDTISAEYNIMLYVTKGCLEIKEDGEKYTLNEGAVFFLKESLNHSIYCAGKKPASYYRIHFFMNTRYPENSANSTIRISSKSGKDSAGSDSENIKETAVNRLYVVPKHVDNAIGSVLDKKIHDYYNYYTSENRPFDLEINTSLYDILAECVKLSGEYRQPQTKLSDEIIDYLNEHSNQQLNTTDMEKRFFLTYKYMGTAFKKETGFTILGYHTNLRMHTARKLLSTTSYSIDEISRLLGYTDALYFSRVFKKNNSVSPQDYRKSHRNTDN